MARIYISSTYSDLKDCREKVYRALKQMDHDVVAMEYYVATDMRPLDKCLHDVGNSDIYVGIFAWRYGFIPEEDNPDQKSITELEYRHACECKIPTLIFILDKDASWPLTFVDRGEESKRIDTLRAELAKRKTVSFFKDCENLATLVSNAVTNKVREREKEKVDAAGGWLEKHLDRTENLFISHMSGMDRLSAEKATARYVELLVEKKSKPDEERAAARPLSEYVVQRGTKRVVLGDGGTGKTTSLLRLAFDAARKARLDLTAPIPIYTKLNFFDTKETAFDKLIDIIAASTGLHRDRVLSLWQDDTRPILFLMDGFNEVGSDFQSSCALALEALIQRPQHLIVITSRPTSQVQPLIERCKIDELRFVQLNDDQLEDFLTRHGVAHLFQQMESELKDLVRNPFLLWALAQSCAGLAKSELPRNKGELYRNLIDRYLFETHEAQKEPSPTEYNYERVKKPVLASIALRMIEEGVTRTVQDKQLLRDVHKQLTEIRADHEGLIDVRPHEFMPDPPSAKGILDEAVLNGVLRRVGDTVEFMHQSVQDYFGAVGMLDWKTDEILKLAPRASLRRSLDRTDGFDAIIMLAGLKKDSRELLNALIGHNLLLAAHGIAAASTAPRTIREALLDQVKTMLRRQNRERRKLACECLGAVRIQSEEFQRELINRALFDKDYYVRDAATSSLALTKTPFALNYVVNVGLNDAHDKKVMKQVQELLFKIDLDASIELLFDEWRKPEIIEARRRRTEILLTPQSWHKQQVSNRLCLIRLDAIRRGDKEASESAKEALARLTDWQQLYQEEMSVFPLASEITKVVEEMERLENLAPSMSLPELIENLNQPNYVAGIIATEIGKRGTKECIEPLIEALYQQHIPRNIAPIVQSLETLDRVKATEILKKDLHSSDVEKQTRAAVGLGLMGDFELITLVERALRMENAAFRGAAAQVLGRCGSDEAVAALADAAKSENDEFVALEILYALSRPKSKRANEVFLYLFLRRHSLASLDRFSRAGEELGSQLERAILQTTGTSEVIERLQEAARDDDSLVRANAITSLGSFDDTRFDIASSLREALDDPDGIVRVAAFSEIVKRTSEIGDLIRLLKEALKDDDPQVRAIALDELAEREIDGAHAVLIESALSDSDSHVREVAAIKLRASLEATINRLSQVLQQDDMDRRVAAIKTLRTLGQNFSIADIRGEALDEGKKELISNLLAHGLEDPNESVRLEALKSLGSIGYFKPVARVEELLLEMAWRDESVNVRQEAAQQLQYMDGGTNVLFKPIFDFINDRDEFPRLIKLIGENEPFLPNDGYLYMVRGSIYEELQNFDKAHDDYERALELNYDTAWLRTRCAMVCSSLGRNEEAVKAALKAVEFEPCNANAHLSLGWHTYKTGDYEKSIEESRIALGLDPSAAMAAFNLGLACVAARRLEDAGAAYEQALEICRNTEDSNGTIEAALKDIDELLIAKPELMPDADQFRSKLSSVLT